MSLVKLLAAHWPEYLIEAFSLGVFMISAGVFTILIDHPDAWLYGVVPDPDVRRALIGIAMGATAVAIVYSPWGKRSGAHMNPAFTLAFLRLGKISPGDATFYLIAQFTGGLLGVVTLAGLLGDLFTAAPVSYVATVPGVAGVSGAFIAEVAISGLMIFVVLSVISHPSRARYAGVVGGLLVATFIAVEAPLSGMSMNPARSFASAAPGGLWSDLWIYFVAPPIGMLLAAGVHTRLGRAEFHCAKWIHAADQRCIHCGYEPNAQSREPSALLEK
ncbi:MAG: aquaporin family protein [Gammaproteobacteria bacterium]|nr:aquaporin family protein [Gammaproteobacteria bacterium]